MAQDTQPASAGTEAAEGKRGFKLEGTPRALVTLGLVAMVAVNIILVLRTFFAAPSLGPDTTARLRATGGEIPLYQGPEGPGRIHLLKPGATVALGDVTRAGGPRYPVHVTIDEHLTVEGLIDEKDIEPGEVDRVRAVLQAGRR